MRQGIPAGLLVVADTLFVRLDGAPGGIDFLAGSAFVEFILDAGFVDFGELLAVRQILMAAVESVIKLGFVDTGPAAACFKRLAVRCGVEGVADF